MRGGGGGLKNTCRRSQKLNGAYNNKQANINDFKERYLLEKDFLLFFLNSK